MATEFHVQRLELTSSDGEIRFTPFTFELSDEHPHCCVIGPSGSGKTTFFKSLIKRFVQDWRDYEDVQAEIHIIRNGLNFYETNGRIGYAAQKPFFLAHKSVRANLMAPFSWCGKSSPRPTAVDEVISDFILDRLVDRKAYKLSAGERQRLNLARMFIANPEIAIIDECFSTMDEALAASVASTIVTKYAKTVRILITGHRRQDLTAFGSSYLRFSYSDVSEPKAYRNVQVTYEYK